jgi:hypothetical protein
MIVLSLCRIPRDSMDREGITNMIEMWEVCPVQVKVSNWYTPSQFLQRSPLPWLEKVI